MEYHTRERELLERLEKDHSLSLEEYALLIRGQTKELTDLAAQKAAAIREQVYGRDVYIRGLIEIGSFCKNNCYYCGIRRGNQGASRYRLTREDILGCCREGYALGFRTFVLQGGEDGTRTDEWLCDLIRTIKAQYPDCALTLSLGERSRESYERLFEAGADRYLLRHETADKAHYEKLHPGELSFDNRMECLWNLKEIGYQTGCGFMVGSPGQTPETLAKDLKFVEEFAPAMCGIGPFIPHHSTPFAGKEPGSLSQTLYLLSLIRLISPGILLPATTALGTIHPRGRELGILAGANVVMPNLSPMENRKKYELYDNKICTGEESAQCRSSIEKRMATIGYALVTDRGDTKVHNTKDGKSARFPERKNQ
ncbi:MAG: [FeFe] hydrogenase H-cluster radical SAM maturase HydE [Eubacteriales bacterium]|nr:[FeFe] hydrogenase H-cluster radical SAM maturase HydE [Eubacteriales bacterium]